MYSVLGDRLTKYDVLVGTFTKEEMIDYLLKELNEISEDYQSCEGVRDELEDALSTIDDLQTEIYELGEKLEECEDRENKS